MQAIQSSLNAFSTGNLTDNAFSLFKALGYESERRRPLEEKTFAGFSAYINEESNFSQKNALVGEWRYVDFLFQLTESELSEQQVMFTSKGIDDRITSYLFFVVELSRTSYSRTELSQITREINKVFPIPVMVLFKYGKYLTLAVIDRQPNKRDESKDVLRKVTLIKDIHFAQPHRAHLEILNDLSLAHLSDINSFLDLHQAWQKVLDTKELNKRFFRELANWYFWAVDSVAFPADEEKDESVRNATSVIRLITRLMFVWFLKEKGLVSDRLFEQHHVKRILKFEDESAYYKAILQNLFFATLNSNMGERKFIAESASGRNSQHFVHNVFRYKTEFLKPEETIKELFDPIPFLNGGLFECLDKEVDADDGKKKKIRVDGFSNHPSNVLRVPDELFFGSEHDIDLNEIYGTKNKRYKVRGLINLLNSYKFTIAENTPIEEEVALDPELLGKVFENLLANYNPETRTTARKQTGSFYTPREIVNYMVDESLIAYLKTKLQTETVGFESFLESQPTFFGNEMRIQQVLEVPVSNNRWQGKDDELEDALRKLFSYSEQANPFNETETEILIKAIDNCKILDPACGSGAFPMGILLKLVHILEKLDPDNLKWREWQKLKAIEETKAAYDIGNKEERESRLHEISEIFDLNSSDYGRKLFLIENCIYGVDIQPIAIQIAKLRFFISLIVDQDFNDDPANNRGIRPLPNLETKFVAANTLIGLEMSGLKPNGVAELEAQLKEVRAKHFGARTRKTKEKYRLEDKRIRTEIANLLKQAGFPETSADQIAQWSPYDQNAKADWFDAEWMFGIDGGFDIVIGNPPYVRHEQIKPLKPIFQKRYQTFVGTADLYVYFYESGCRMLRDSGTLSYISSNSFFNSGFGEKLRGFLQSQTTLKQIVDFAETPVFEATTEPCIVILTKHKANGNSVLCWKWDENAPLENLTQVLQTNAFELKQSSLTKESWRLENPATLRLIDKMRKPSSQLSDYVNGKVYRGIVTGLNEAFVVDKATRDRLIAKEAKSSQLLKPFLRGRDVKRWSAEFAEQYLIKIESSSNKQHAWSGKPSAEAEKIFSETYPALYEHFQAFREKLIKRDDQGAYFWELRACVYWHEFETPKIVYQDIARYYGMAWDDSAAFLANTCYFIPNANKFLLGILLSKAMKYYVSKVIGSDEGGFIRLFSTRLWPIRERKK